MASLDAPPHARRNDAAAARRVATARIAGLCALALVVAACDAADRGGADRAGAPEADPRYRLEIETRGPASRDAEGEIRIAVRTQADWHLAPRAPAELALEDGDGVTFGAAQRSVGPGPGDASLAFTSRFRCSGPGDVVARGRVRFGMCQGDSERCVIVERDLAIPLAVAFPE